MKKAAQAIRCAASPRAAQDWLRESRGTATVGFVPTMGALHEGHLELVRRARRENELVVVSIFVNPLQFNDPRDLARYPRDFERDAALLEAAGCDLVFTGELVGERGFFPEAAAAADIDELEPGPGALGLEGALRPGHFAGVATIVDRLFAIVAPTRAYFGQKDFQQTQVVQGLGAACDVVICPIEREPHGLARSSRNELLSAEVRAAAGCLVATLEWGAWLFRAGERASDALERGMAAYFADHAPAEFELEYTAVRDPRAWSAAAPHALNAHGVALIAASAPGAGGGRVRLIDNLLLHEVAARAAHGEADADAGERFVERPRPARVRLLAPAKLNPWLHVLGKRDDGFHEVDLALQAIDLCDVVTLTLEADAQRGDSTEVPAVAIAVDGPAASADVPTDASNLAVRALATAPLRGWRGTLQLHVTKHTPSRAGLGGGSSDAAAARLAAERLGAWLGGAAPARAARAAALAELGSDTVFFGVQSEPARATGRGETLTALTTGVVTERLHPPGTWFVVVTPAVECPTARVFQAWSAHPPEPGARNDLQAAALAAVPGLAAARAALTRCAPGPWLLAGSGSSFYLALDPSGPAPQLAEWTARITAELPDARYIGLHQAFAGGFHGSACRMVPTEAR